MPFLSRELSLKVSQANLLYAIQLAHIGFRFDWLIESKRFIVLSYLSDEGKVQ